VKQALHLPVLPLACLDWLTGFCSKQHV
jgi:hypothetical protein